MNIDEIFGQFALMSAFVERAVQMIKGLVKYNDFAPQYQQYIDMALSGGFNIALAFGWQFDVFAQFNLHFGVEWLGFVMTGVLATAGSELIHEVLELVKMYRQNQKPL